MANSFLSPEVDALAHERRFPLKVMVCLSCGLAQTTTTIPAGEIFTRDYAYLSSFSASWLMHASRYAEAMISRFGLGPQSRVVEIASNDGYLLRHFAAKSIPVLGVEPAANAAAIAETHCVPTRVMFFNRDTAARLAAEGFAADLMAANNVLAHVPDIADFVAGFAVLLKPDGVATFEFPHLLRLLEGVQFDTIYHEHYSYLSLLAVERIFSACGLAVFDVEEFPTHGGSLRVYAQHCLGPHHGTSAIAARRADEAAAGLDQVETYLRFGQAVGAVVADFHTFLNCAKAQGKTVAAYGAAAKGNTFLNVCGITAADIAFIVDRSSVKQGKLLPGSHIPIKAPDHLKIAKPDYVVILPWNLADEIRAANNFVHSWGGRFLIAVPKIQVF